MTQESTRRIAAHTIRWPDGSVVRMGVVTLVNGSVAEVNPLQGEQPFTEWLGGTIELRMTDNGQLAAYKNDVKINRQ